MWPFRKKGLIARSIYAVTPCCTWGTPQYKDVVKFLRSILEPDRVSTRDSDQGILLYLPEDSDFYASEIGRAISIRFDSVDFDNYDTGLWIFDHKGDGKWFNVNYLGWCSQCNQIRSFYHQHFMGDGVDNIACRSCKTQVNLGDKKVAFIYYEQSNEEILRNAAAQQKLAAKAG